MTRSQPILTHDRPIRKPASQNALTPSEFRRLAEFRFALLGFLHFSGSAAEAAGVPPHQYQLLLAVQGMPQGMEPSIANVASRLLLKHNSAVELVDRTIDQGFLRRTADPTDHRRILLRLTGDGDQLLRSLAEHHLAELEEVGPELIRTLQRATRVTPPTPGALSGPERSER